MINRKALIDHIKGNSANSRGKQDLSGFYLNAKTLVEMVESGAFDIPSSESEGEAERLRTALKLVKSEVAIYSTASVYEKVCDIVNPALEGSTSETTIDAVDHFVDAMEKRNWGTSETAVQPVGTERIRNKYDILEKYFNVGTSSANQTIGTGCFG